MKNKDRYIELFSGLDERLAGFGSDKESSAAISAAVKANPWFTEDDIRFAVRSLREDMLRRDILEKWLSRYDIGYETTRNVAVIMAGNIPLVGFFDMMCVLACGHGCHIKPSSKDSALINYIVSLLRELDGHIPVFEYSPDAAYYAVIATGSDNTNRYFRSEFSGIPALLRGSRASVAILDGNETEEQLRSLSEDIFRYNGMGCRNVSLVFLPEGYAPGQLAAAVSPERVNSKYRSNYLQSRALLSMQGRKFTDGGCFLLTEERAFPYTLSRINYSYYKDRSEVAEWLAANESGIQVVSAADPAVFPRTVPLGRAQHPAPWDYADGKDVIEFLISK